MSTQRFEVGVSRFSCGAGRKDSRRRIPALAGRAGSARPVRSAPRKGFLRRRLHRRHQGPQVAQDRRGRDRDPVQSRTSRRGRRRSARRRRRRHPGADPAQVLRPQGRRARHRAARARPLRGRLGVHAARSGMAEDHSRCLCGEDPAGRPDAARLARGAVRQFLARRVGEADRAVPHAGVHRPRPGRSRPRTISSAGSTSCARSSPTRSIASASGGCRTITSCRCRAAR